MAIIKIQIFPPQDAALSFILNSKKTEIVKGFALTLST